MACLAPEPLFGLRNRWFWDVRGEDGACGVGEEDEVEVGHQHSQHRQKREPKANTSQTAATRCCNPVQQPVIDTKTHTHTIKKYSKKVLLIHIEYLRLKMKLKTEIYSITGFLQFL